MARHEPVWMANGAENANMSIHRKLSRAQICTEFAYRDAFLVLLLVPFKSFGISDSAANADVIPIFFKNDSNDSNSF